MQNLSAKMWHSQKKSHIYAIWRVECKPHKPYFLAWALYNRLECIASCHVLKKGLLDVFSPSSESFNLIIELKLLSLFNDQARPNRKKVHSFLDDEVQLDCARFSRNLIYFTLFPSLNRKRKLSRFNDSLPLGWKFHRLYSHIQSIDGRK